MPPTKTPIWEIAKMLMVITTTADEFMKHLTIHLPTAYLELVLHIYKSWIACFSVFSKLNMHLYLFFFPIFTSPQRDFACREELQQSDVERWLGFITFLCEVFGTMRSSSAEPFRVLVCPIYTCLREVCIQIYSFFINKYVSYQLISLAQQCKLLG